jgi:hypothetical protein
MKRPPARDVPYHALLGLFRSAHACPICEAESEHVRRSLAWLFYESVNDPDVRHDLLQRRGFCRRHASTVLELEGVDVVGKALVYQDQVAAFIDFLPSLSHASRRRGTSALAREWTAHKSCPACAQERECGDSHLRLLLSRLDDSEVRQAFEESPVLCVPHFIAAITLAEQEVAKRYLVEVQQRKASRLLAELREFCRKHDYRFAHEAFGSERDSWGRAIQMMTGNSRERS